LVAEKKCAAVALQVALFFSASRVHAEARALTGRRKRADV